MNRLLLTLSVLACAAFAQTPVVVPGGVLNGASFDKTQPVAPGSLVSIFGTDLASDLAQNDTVPLSTKLGDTSVTFNGIPAGLYFVSPGQINAQIPWNVLPDGVTTGQATVLVTRGSVTSAPQSANIGPVAPGVFYIGTTGGNWAIAINGDGSLAAPENAIPGFPTHPATLGDPIAILGTGLGAVTPPVANGADALDALRNANVQPDVLVGGVTAPVGFAGLAPQFPGVNQINVTVPSAAARGVVSLQLRSNGVTSTDTVKMATR